MKPIAKLACKVNGVYYDKGDEIDVTRKDQLIKLNEKGFIEPLTPKQIQDFDKNHNILKKEEK